MVKRLNLIFDDEDRETFYNRLERAIKRRNVAENKRNYYGKIDSLIPDSAIGIIPDTMIQNVYKKIGPLASKYSDIVVL